MRHRKSVKKLGRTAAHRKATLSNLSSALIERKHIMTTVAKAKAVRPFVEKLITMAKKQTIHARRMTFAVLHQQRIVKILFDEVAPRYLDRPGGYTRIVKLGNREGDGAPIAVLELVGFETAMKKKKEKEEKAAAEEKKKKKSKEKGEAKKESGKESEEAASEKKKGGPSKEKKESKETKGPRTKTPKRPKRSKR